MSEIKIVAEPFSWNEKFADEALEYFSCYQREMSYCASQTIGTALAKLKLMEDNGLNPDTLERVLKRLEEKAYEANQYCQASIEKKYIFDQVSHAARCGAYSMAVKIIKEEVKA